MENAADALMMAGAVLIFILILSIVFLAFTNARESIDTVFQLADKETMTIEENSNYYYLSTAGANINRTVGLETVIPAIYRAFDENYKIEFVFGDGSDYYLYKDKEGKEITTIDLSEMALTISQKESLIEAILYHTYKGTNDNMAQFNNDFKNNRGWNKYR